MPAQEFEDVIFNKTPVGRQAEAAFLFMFFIFRLEIDDRVLDRVKGQEWFTPVKIDKIQIGKKGKEKIERSPYRGDVKTLLSLLLITVRTFIVALFGEKEGETRQLHFSNGKKRLRQLKNSRSKKSVSLYFFVRLIIIGAVPRIFPNGQTLILLAK